MTSFYASQTIIGIIKNTHPVYLYNQTHNYNFVANNLSYIRHTSKAKPKISLHQSNADIVVYSDVSEISEHINEYVDLGRFVFKQQTACQIEILNKKIVKVPGITVPHYIALRSNGVFAKSLLKDLVVLACIK